MTDAKDREGKLLPDEYRLPPFGRFLRSTSLDELPEIYNVIKGDMSLVGPRPLLTQYLDRYSETERRRHAVRPGITGLAQVNGRNSASWAEKFVLDIKYVDCVSLRVDLAVLFATLVPVILRSGIRAGDGVSAPEFFPDSEHHQSSLRLHG